MQAAGEAARQHSNSYLGTEHILLGLISEDDGMSADVLKSLNVDVNRIRRDIEKLVQEPPNLFAVIKQLEISDEEIEQLSQTIARRRSDVLTAGKVPMTPRAQKVIEYSFDEAKNLRHTHVDTGDILLGLLREDQAPAFYVLMNRGLTFQAVCDKIQSFSQQAERQSGH